MSVHWPSVTNLANSNIGVGILALPSCVKSMGFLLGSVVLLVTGYMTVQISSLLIYAAHHSKSRSYEQLSMKSYGNSGKRLCELCICALNYGMLVSFHCVIGDSSTMLAQILGVEDTASWRLTVQLVVVLFMALPSSLLRNLSSLNILSVVALFIYSSFTVFIFSHGVGEWLIQPGPSDVSWIDWGGLLKSFPIIFLAFNCQTSLLPIYNELPNSSMKKMTRVATYAILFVGLLYSIIGICGVLSFGTKTDGNVLNNFPVSSLIVLFKLGFVLSIAFSFPLVIYPMRISINSLFLADVGDPNHMNVRVFRTITVTVIFSSLALSILFPEVDVVLALCGASFGSFIGMIFPALIFLKMSDRGEGGRGFAKFMLCLGLLTTTLGVSNILFGGKPEVSSSGNLNPKHFNVDAVEPHVEVNNEVFDAKTLGNAEIISMLEKLQSELDETKRELRAEKALRIETQIKELKEQLKLQKVEVEPDQSVPDEKQEAEVNQQQPVVEQQPLQEVAQQPEQQQEEGEPIIEEKQPEPLQPPAQPEVINPEQPEVQQKEEDVVKKEVADNVEIVAPAIDAPPAAADTVKKDEVGRGDAGEVAEKEVHPEIKQGDNGSIVNDGGHPNKTNGDNNALAAVPVEKQLEPEEVQEKLEQLKKLEQEKVELMAEVLKDENQVDTSLLKGQGESDPEQQGIDSNEKSGDKVVDADVQPFEDSIIETKVDGEM